MSAGPCGQQDVSATPGAEVTRPIPARQPIAGNGACVPFPLSCNRLVYVTSASVVWRSCLRAQPDLAVKARIANLAAPPAVCVVDEGIHACFATAGLACWAC